MLFAFSNFSTFIDRDYGNCFQFNGANGTNSLKDQKVLKVRDAGILHGTKYRVIIFIKYSI